jgi:hypothetical protein
MKRTLAGLFAMTALLVGGSTALATPAPPPGTSDDTTIKACADYSTLPHSDGTYDSTTGLLSFRVVMADYMCKNVTYSFFVFAGTSPASGAPLFTDVRSGDSATNIYIVTATLTSKPSSACVYVTTTAPNGELQDRAPDLSGSCHVLGGVSSGGMW